MPPGKGRYTIGGKGTHGCKGYPVVGGEGKVHGCHPTRGAAIRQQAAIYASQNQRTKSVEILDMLKMHDDFEQTWSINDITEQGGTIPLFNIVNNDGVVKGIFVNKEQAEKIVAEHNEMVDTDITKSFWEQSPFGFRK